jgi:ribosomal-protein-alanine N-acetyltransferase
MTKKHIPEVAQIEQDTFPIPWSAEMFDNELRHDYTVYFVAENITDKSVLGYAGMWHIVNEGQIANIAVRDDARGQGIGTSLINRLIRTARQREMMGLTLEVSINNRNAQRLYTKLGFKPEGIRKGYYETGEDAIIMWVYLRCV